MPDPQPLIVVLERAGLLDGPGSTDTDLARLTAVPGGAALGPAETAIAGGQPDVHLTEKRVQLSQHLWAALARMAQPGETEDATLARLLRSHPEMRNVLADADPPEGGVADPQ